MPTIEDLLKDTRYQQADSAKKQEYLSKFFDAYVTQDSRYQSAPEQQKTEYRAKFISRYVTPEPTPQAQPEQPNQRTLKEMMSPQATGAPSLGVDAAVREGTQTMGAEDKYAAAYAKVMKDRADAQREVEYAKRAKESAILSRAEYVPLESVKLPFSMDEALSGRIEEAQFKLQPNSYTDPLERKAAKDIVNKEKLSKAKQDYQRLTEAFSDPANADNKEQIHSDMVKTQYLMDYYATGMTADERAAMKAGQDVAKDGGAKRLGTAVGAGTLDIAGSVISLFNPDSKYARTMSSYTAGLLGKTDNPVEDAFAQVFFSMPMTLGYVVSGGLGGLADAATLMHTVNINAYLMSKEFGEAYREYGTATATPNGAYVAGTISSILETAVEMYSDVAQANLVLGKMKKLGRAGAEEFVKRELRGKIAGYVGRAGKTMLTAGGTEMAEEAIQNTTDMIIDVVADQRPMPSMAEAIKEIGYASLVGGLGGLTFGLAGGTITESKNFYNWRNVYKLADKGNEHAKHLAEARKIIDSKTFSAKPVPQSDIQRAYEVIKDDLRAVANGTYSEDDPNIVSAMSQMYDAFAIAGVIKSPQQEQMSEGVRKGVDEYLLRKKIDAAKSQTKQEGTTQNIQTDYASIQSLVDKAVETKSQADIDAAQAAIQTAVTAGDRSDEIQVLTTSLRAVRPVKAKAVKPKPAEPTPAPSAETAETPKAEEKVESKYANTPYKELRTKAKELGINTFGVKKAALISQIDAKEAETDRQLKEIKDQQDKFAALVPVISETVNSVKDVDDPEQLGAAITKLREIRKDADSGSRTIIDKHIQKLTARKEKWSINDLAEKKTKQSLSMPAGNANETIDRRPIEETGAIPKERIGKKAVVSKEDNEMEVQYALVDIDDVIVSQDLDTFKDNPEYPKELQNRDRSEQKASTLEKAAKLKPYMLGEAAVASDGRPIGFIDTNGRIVVIAGNERTMAIKMRHRGDYGGLSEYEDYLKENLSKFGIADQDTKGRMLIALYNGEENIVSMAKLLNQVEQKQMDAVETAKSDAIEIANAKKHGNDIVDLLDTNTKGLMTEANKPFIDAFIELNIPKTGIDLYYKDRQYTEDLRTRIENALFMYIFSNSKKAEVLLSNMRVIGDSSVKNLLKGIMDNSKQIAKLRNLIEKHNLVDLDITQDLIDAVYEINRMKAEGVSISQALYEQDLFSADQALVPEDKMALYKVIAGITSQQQAYEFIAEYYATAFMALDPEQYSLWSKETNKEEFLNEKANEWLERKTKKDTGTNPKGNKASERDAGRQAPPSKAEVKPPAPAPEAPKLTPSEAFKQQWRDAQQGKLTKEELDAQLTVLDAFMETMAAELKMSVDDLYSTYLGDVTNKGRTDELARLKAEKGIIRGYIRLLNGKASFTFLDPDITTGFHEMAHLGQEFIKILAKNDSTGKWQNLLKDAEAYCGVKDGVWTKEADEKFAVSFERYMYDGVAPTSKLKTVFEKVRGWIAKLLDRVKTLSGYDLSPEIINVYNVMLGGEYVAPAVKPTLTSEQKKQSVKLKAELKREQSVDPDHLETQLDKLANAKGLILKAKKTGANIAFYITDPDGATLIEIHTEGEGYNVNGFFDYNNGDAIARVNDLLGQVKGQATSSLEIAEAERQMEAVRKQYQGIEPFSTPSQKISSADTSINASRLPASFRKIDWARGTVNADIGGGRFDNATEYLAEHGVDNVIYDPYNRSPEHNEKAISKIKDGKSDTATVNNVLNVIQEAEAREQVIVNAANAIKRDGTAYFLMYEGDGSGFGKVTSKGWQENRKSADYVEEIRKHFDIVKIKNGMIEASHPKPAQYKDTYLKAPNGKPSNLNERQWLQVRTENFLKWFGDWLNDPKNASKVVDENGEPMVVYHGTPIDEMNEHYGGWWSDDPRVAEEFGNNIYPAYLNIRNPLFASEDNEEAQEAYRKITGHEYDTETSEMNIADELAYRYKDDLTAIGYDGIVSWDETNLVSSYAHVPLAPTQIKSATGNVGTFDAENPDIRYQAVNDATDEAAKTATDKAQERIAKINEAAKNAQIRARATYRALRVKMNARAVVTHWENAMRKSLVVAVKNAFPGCAPLNVPLYDALKEQLEQLDPGIEEEAKERAKIKRKMSQMLVKNKRFKENLASVSGGYDDVAYIPFEQLFTALSNTNPAAYDAFMNDEAMDVLIKILPKIRESFGEEFNDAVFQQIVNVIMTEGNEYWSKRDWISQFVQPQRYLTSIFGRAGAKTASLAYLGTRANSLYEAAYAPYTDKLYTLLMTNKNNRGAAYEGEQGDIIGRTIFEVDGDSEITDKLPTIQQRLADWGKRNNAIINPLDVEQVYEAKEKIKEIIKDFILEFNADPNHTRKIGIREDYDNPRNYKWGNLSEITAKFGRYLFTPANAKRRQKEDFEAGLDYNANIFEAYRNYAYAMTKYMAFYDLANYVEDSTVIIPIKDKETGQYKNMYKKMGSQFDLDLSLAQRNASKAGRDYLNNYVKDVIGYHKSNDPGSRLISAMRSNLYTSTLTANVMMTVLNYNQRNLIFSAVDPKIAWQVKDDFKFWSGMMTEDVAKYPTLSSIMQSYVIANQSLLAELSAEVKQNAEVGRTKYSRAYYKHTAEYNDWLRKSYFTKAELGNRAWAHAAGVYQIAQNSKEYKAGIEAGMSSHAAMENALKNNISLQKAAIVYGGIINAEVNADANPAFSPAMFRESAKMNKLAAFLRYGTTITLLELRTYGGMKDLESALSPDLFKLLTSGNAQAATMAQTIQAAQIMKAWTAPDRIEQRYKKMGISKEDSPYMLSSRQVALVHDAISDALNTYTESTKTEFADIVRGKQGQKKAMAMLFAFSLSEVVLRFALELLLSLIPWWQGKKKLKDTDIISNITSIFGIFQTTKTVANYRLGVGLMPELNYYNRTDKQFFKAMSQAIIRLTPFAGTINYAGRAFTGKYLSDQFWDKVYD